MAMKFPRDKEKRQRPILHKEMSRDQEKQFQKRFAAARRDWTESKLEHKKD